MRLAIDKWGGDSDSEGEGEACVIVSFPSEKGG